MVRVFRDADNCHQQKPPAHPHPPHAHYENKSISSISQDSISKPLIQSKHHSPVRQPLTFKD